MNRPASGWLALAALLLPGFAASQEPAAGMVPAYPGWQHSGALMILTTPEGADLPAGATVDWTPRKSLPKD